MLGTLKIIVKRMETGGRPNEFRENTAQLPPGQGHLLSHPNLWP